MNLLEMNRVAYDTECLRDVKPPYSFKEANFLGNAVTCTLANGTDYKDWVLDTNVPALWMYLSQFQLHITWNGPGFDEKLLGGSMLMPEHPKAKTFFNDCFKGRRVDLMKSCAKAMKARFVKLEDVSIPTLGLYKEMEGGFAPEQWRQGKCLEVITYCRSDSKKTDALFLLAVQGKVMKYQKGARDHPNAPIVEFTCAKVIVE